jgi:hypothetical protein
MSYRTYNFDMLWWIGAGLIVLWAILSIFAYRGWVPLLLLSGICVLIVQTAAYRKTKTHR